MDTYQNKYLKYKNKYLKLRNNLNNSLSNTTQTGGGNKKTLTLIKADWCGHCQRFKETWEALPTKIKYINFKTLDNDLNKDEIKKYEFKVVPSIFLEDGDDITEYTGKRDIESLKKFVESN